MDYHKDYLYKVSINYILDNIDNPFDFFFELGTKELKSKRLQDTFKLLDDFIKNIHLLEDAFERYYNNDYYKVSINYNEFHKLLILDYLNIHNIKPTCFWNEKISPKEKNELLRNYKEKNLLSEDLSTLYKYSLVIPLKNEVIIAIYKDNKRKIYTLKTEAYVVN